jgi:hypothetical protein
MQKGEQYNCFSKLCCHIEAARKDKRQKNEIRKIIWPHYEIVNCPWPGVAW